jgi:hypothetical protein
VPLRGPAADGEPLTGDGFIRGGAPPILPVIPVAPVRPVEEPGFDASAAINQSLLFLALQHTFRMTEEKTTRELGGPFFKDWFHAIGGLGGWKDGGRQFTNYVAHPMQGALAGYLQIQNDANGKREQFGGSGQYWKSRAKAMGWAAIYSTQFELGPLSQASIGNVGAGLYEDKKMGYVDLVITPTLGTGLIVLEDLLDVHFIRWLERKTGNAVARRLLRVTFNPMRACANVFRFKTPWYRDLRRLRSN